MGGDRVYLYERSHPGDNVDFFGDISDVYNVLEGDLICQVVLIAGVILNWLKSDRW